MNSAFQFDDFGTALNTDGNNYDLVERITAGYFMNSIDLGRVRIQTGLRFEATHEGLLGNKVTDPLSGSTLPTVTPLPVDSSYLDPLPSVLLYGVPRYWALRCVSLLNRGWSPRLGTPI